MDFGKIIELSKTACERASELLSHVNQLADEVGSEDGQVLDQCGAKLVDVVQGLLTSAQIVAPSIGDTRCQSTMLAAADEVSSCSQKLESCWAPLVSTPHRQTLRQDLENGRSELETALDKLRTACWDLGEVKDGASGGRYKDKGQERLKFTATLASAKEKMSEAEKNLEKPIVKNVHTEEAEDLQRKLGHLLAQLNAAIASLVNATSNPEDIDYNAAENAVRNLTQLLPEVIQDTQSLSTTCDEPSKHAMLSQLQQVFQASRDLCKHTEYKSPQAINDAALKFAEASGKLCYVFNKTPNRNDNLISDLSKDACEKANLMLSSVHQLAEAVGGEDGRTLNQNARKVVEAARTMHVTAQVLEPCITDPSCKSSLLSAIDNVTAAHQKLNSTCRPMKKEQKLADAVENDGKELESALNNLRKVCTQIKDTPQEIKRRIVRDVGVEEGGVKSNPVEELIKIGKSSKEVYNLATEIAEESKSLVSGMEGEMVDQVKESGEELVDAAQQLYSAIAQEVQECKDGSCNINRVLLGIRAVSAASSDLTNTRSHLDLGSEEKKIAKNLEQKEKALTVALNEMIFASSSIAKGSEENLCNIDEKTRQWLTFMFKISDAARELDTAVEEIDKPVEQPQHIISVQDVQKRTAQKLEELNTAVASLVNATSDVNLLCVLEGDGADMKVQLKSLSQALKDIYEAIDGRNIKIEELAMVARSKALELLDEMNDMAKSEQGDDCSWLAAAGEKLSNAAEKLLITSQYFLLTSLYTCVYYTDETQDAISRFIDVVNIPTILAYSLRKQYGDTELALDKKMYKSTLQFATYELSAAADELSSSCRNLGKPSQSWKSRIEARERDLHSAIKALKDACGFENGENAREMSKKKFAKEVSAAKNCIRKAEKDLDKPPVQSARDTELQRAMPQQLAGLNAAVASLVQASDPVNPNYEDAEVAVQTIPEYLGNIIRGSRAGLMDDGNKVVKMLKELCKATEELVSQAEMGQAKSAYDSISKYVDVTSDISHACNPNIDIHTENLV
ncbi:talin-2-like [Battus philenor]|uniref:talin-2-like n=1 Tax=Battus philenor TaxID=42288 RepID=UPI0035CF9B1C